MEAFCRRCQDRYMRARAWRQAEADGDYERMVSLADSVGVHEHFCQNDRWPGFDDDGLREQIARQPLPNGRGILAVGVPGTHKTHLLTARTIDAAKRGHTARLMNWPLFDIEVRSTYQDAATETERHVFHRYADLEYLAIDDLGVEKAGDHATRLIYQMLNYRSERRLLTDVSSNWLPDELAKRFDDHGRVGRRVELLCEAYPMFLGR